MEWYVILIIVLAVIGAGTVLTRLFKSKKVAGSVAADKAEIQKNVVFINKLKIILEFSVEICGKLDELKAAYEFVSPKASGETLKTDKRIGGYLEEIEICSKKAEKNGDFTEIEGLLKKIRITIAER